MESMEGKRFAVTGGIKDLRRQAIVAAIRESGGEVTERAYGRAAFDALIVCDTPEGRETNKLRYVESRGIPLLDFDEFVARYGVVFDRPPPVGLDEPTAAAAAQDTGDLRLS